MLYEYKAEVKKYKDIAIGERFSSRREGINERYIKTDMKQYDGGDPAVAVSLWTGKTDTFESEEEVYVEE